MIRGKIFFGFVILLLSQGLLAQSFPQDNWYPGHVTLTTGVKKEGIIKYDLEANSIQLQWDDKIETYHANQFNTFSILLRKQQVYRNFYVLPHANNSGYKRPTIFELIVEGEMSLLAREYIAIRNANMNSGFYGNRWGGNPYTPRTTQRYLAYRLFLVDNKGRVKPLTTKKKEVIAAFGRHEKELKSFIKREKIKTDQIMDMGELVAYYNTLNL